MTDGALASASTYAQVRVREPIGDRTLGETPTIGGEGADIVVPGVGPGLAVQVERRKGVWIVHPVGDTRVRFDGRVLNTPRDLRRHDVLAVGDAQVVVTDVSRTLLRLDVCHLVGRGYPITLGSGDELGPVGETELPRNQVKSLALGDSVGARVSFSKKLEAAKLFCFGHIHTLKMIRPCAR